MSEIPSVLEKKFWEDVSEIMKAYLAEGKRRVAKSDKLGCEIRCLNRNE